LLPEFVRAGGLALVAAALVISGCADRRGGTIPYDRVLAAPDERTFVTLPAGYKIAPMDTISVKVYRVPEVTGDYSVDLAGNISMPLVGAVPAANRTTEELQNDLRRTLGAKYFENPDVSVVIKASTAHAVTVDGAVRDGGSFPVSGNMTLIQAIAMAKGTTEDANARRVAVFRTVGGQRQAAAFDLTAIRRGQAPDPAIYPGDIVVVDGSSIKAAQKQILQSLPLLSIFRPLGL